MFHNNSPRQVWFRPPAASDLPNLAAGGEKRDLQIGRVDLSAARQCANLSKLFSPNGMQPLGRIYET